MGRNVRNVEFKIKRVIQERKSEEETRLLLSEQKPAKGPPHLSFEAFMRKCRWLLLPFFTPSENNPISFTAITL